MYSNSTLTIVQGLHWGTTISSESTLIYHYHHLWPWHHFINTKVFVQMN